MFAAKGEQLGRQNRSAARSLSDFADVIGDGVLHSELVEKQVAIAENGGEKIVKVMSDATGELAERFHLLRPNELVLELFARGHIHERPDELESFAVGIANDESAFEKIEIRTVQVPEAVFSSPMIAVRGERIAQGAGGAGPILGMNLFLPEPDFVRSVGTGVTEQSLEALRPGERAGGYRPNPNSIIRSLGNERKMLRDFIRAAR